MCAFNPRRPWAAGLLAGLALLAGSCVKPYSAPVPDPSRSYLVVDGFINAQGTSTFQLSHTLALAGTKPTTENKATVYIRDEAGTQYPLTERPAGTYTSASLNLNPTHRYQLALTTTAGRNYQSDLVPVKTTPAIDTISWKYVGDGVQVYVSSHDDHNQTTYYRWNYAETWRFTSAFYSHVFFDKSTGFQQRNNDIYNCWSTVASTNVNLGNTATLTHNVLTNQPLVFLPNTSPKLRIRYSILVQQMAQTADEYHYWETLKRNTESIGSLYDALPTQLTGNVHSPDDPTEPVLGYVGAHTVVEHRIFIDRSELPLSMNWTFQTGYESCGNVPQTFLLFDAQAVFSTPNYVPVDFVYDANGVVTGYTGASPECVDCQLHGSNLRPSFWY